MSTVSNRAGSLSSGQFESNRRYAARCRLSKSDSARTIASTVRRSSCSGSDVGPPINYVPPAYVVLQLFEFRNKNSENHPDKTWKQWRVHFGTPRSKGSGSALNKTRLLNENRKTCAFVDSKNSCKHRKSSIASSE